MSALSDMVARLDFAIRTLDQAIRLACQAAAVARVSARKVAQAGEGAKKAAPGMSVAAAGRAAGDAEAMAATLVSARDNLIAYTQAIRARYRPPPTPAQPATASVTGTAGGGSGPWVPDQGRVNHGGAISQTHPGSCVSACGQMLTDDAVNQQKFLDQLGEWCPPENLAPALNARAASTNPDSPPWEGGFFNDGPEAVATARSGRIGAAVVAPGTPLHMVVIEPCDDGRFLVRDPLPGVSYHVDAEWIHRYVAAGVYR